MSQGTANPQTYLIHRELLLRPPSDRAMYEGVTIERAGEWNLELWMYFKSPLDEHGLLMQLEGVQDGDSAMRKQTQHGVSHDAETGFLNSNDADLNLFPVGTISPELQETFLTNELRLQVIAVIDHLSLSRHPQPSVIAPEIGCIMRRGAHNYGACNCV
jgi:hypothetical protein